ncbi:MAG TPA: galactokinase [Planctomycetota bacterium]|nr:galactokinase [Planctomycetota bacterium]
MEHRVNQLREAFARLYGDSQNTLLARAPGRVNLIGEHTDYNDGYVLPIAIDKDALVLFRSSGSSAVRIHSLNYGQSASFSLDDEKPDPAVQWLRYPFGVAKVLHEHAGALAGIDAVIESTVPLGGGLSSSAAIEVSFALAFCAASKLELDKLTLAKLCQKAEHRYAGVNCGIMDQYVSLHAEKDNAVFIDCRNITHKLVPFRTDAVKLVVCDTGVRHSLAGSEYNVRRSQCEQGAAWFSRINENVKNLRDLSPDDIKAAGDLDPVVLKRCRHVVSEDARVLEAVKALRRRNVYQFGVLMSASHDSLKNDYEVSCRELDLMVNIADEQKGVFGSRMTGGGFGGCVISLVAVESVDPFCTALAKQYEAATKIRPQIYVVSAEAGAGIV